MIELSFKKGKRISKNFSFFLLFILSSLLHGNVAITVLNEKTKMVKNDAGNYSYVTFVLQISQILKIKYQIRDKSKPQKT